MTRRHWIALWLSSTGLTLLILAPIFRPGHLLIRDMVSTPRSYLTDTALGLGDSAPRAVPQDWFIAVASHVVDGGVVVKVLTFAALLLAGAGYGRLARLALPASGTPGMIAAVVITIWNPYVAERLLQGQWSLLFGYASLGWLFVCAVQVRRGGSYAHWSALGGWLAVAGFTPTGSLLAAFTLLPALVFPALIRGAPTTHRLRTAAIALGVWLLSALPWLTAAAVGGSATASADSGSVAVFAARAEPLLGTVGSVLGMGGIWNAGAVPASRSSGWALVATALLLIVVAIGLPTLYRRRRNPVIVGAAGLGVAAIVLVVLAATPPGIAVLEWLVEAIPGAGLLRDTQKWIALAAPLYALAAAAAVQVIGRYVPRAFAATIAAALIMAPLPDLAWGVGNTLTPSTYPTDWQRVSDVIGPGQGDVLILPTGMNREYGFTGHVSLDPAPRLLRADVLQTGELVVGGNSVDVSDSRAARAEAALVAGADPSVLSELGVGWILVEGDSGSIGDAPRTLAQLDTVFAGDDLQVHQVQAPRSFAASGTDRTLVWIAHLWWILLIANAFVAAVLQWAHRSAHRKRIS
ncbi:hypothetical protein DFR67_105297 [Williamsia limnetica]|uniref:Transmembrane protein n=1 Tax=Williamsia limnetica TaxID=882452 RepID=A0A318RP30_WILLI|nr:hypothetical protein [Williamsia limnetica]PYE18152.1 hypothetical protein DFR67_105297 [Williamsia limnetica]